MARRHGRRRSHGRHRRRMIRNRRGVGGGLLGKFKAAFRRPVSHVITPILGVSALLTIVFAVDQNGYSVATDLFALAGFNMDGTKGTPNLAAMQNIPAHLVNGLGASIPLLVGTAVAAFFGRALRI